MDKNTNNENDYSFSLIFNLSSAVIVATIFVLASFVVIGAVLNQGKDVTDKLWDLTLGMFLVFVGVPVAMKVNQQSRNAQKQETLENFCIRLHFYLQESIRHIDNSTMFFIDDMKPPISPSVEFFQHSEWTDRIPILKNYELVEKIEKVKQRIDSYIDFLNATTKSPMTGVWLHFVVKASIGAKRHAQLRQMFRGEDCKIEYLYTNEGLNGYFIDLIDTLQTFMKSKGFHFTEWNQERIEIVRQFIASENAKNDQ